MSLTTKQPRTKLERQIFILSFPRLAHLAIYRGLTSLGEHVWEATQERYAEAYEAAEQLSSELGHSICVI